MQKTDNNELVNDEEVEEEILPQPDLSDFSEIDAGEPGSNLSIKQKVSLIAAGIISFLFFIIVLFPYDELIKNYIYKTKIPGFTIDFTSLEFPFFGRKIIHTLSLNTDGGTAIKSEEFIVDVSLFSYLASNNIMGEIKLNSTRIENDKIGFHFKTVYANSELSGTESIDKLKGNFLIRISGGDIFRIPEIPMLGQLEKLNLNNSVLNFKIQNGNMVFQPNSNLNTSIAKIFLEGNIVLNQNPAFSSINLRLCPKFKADFETERPDIVSTMQLLPKNAAGIGCIPISGNFQNPQINLPMAQ